jgi:hypothetical protein
VEDDMPRNEVEAEVYIRQIYDAITDTFDCVFSRTDHSLNKLFRGQYQVQQILLVCYILVQDVVDFHSRCGRRIHAKYLSSRQEHLESAIEEQRVRSTERM